MLSEMRSGMFIDEFKAAPSSDATTHDTTGLSLGNGITPLTQRLPQIIRRDQRQRFIQTREFLAEHPVETGH